MTEDDRGLWMMVRQALLLIIDAVEKRFKIQPRTSALRKFAKAWHEEERKKSQG